MRSKTPNSEKSRVEIKTSEDLDLRSTTRSQYRQRNGEHGTDKQGGQGSLVEERFAPRLECFDLGRRRSHKSRQRPGSENSGTRAGYREVSPGAGDCRGPIYSRPGASPTHEAIAGTDRAHPRPTSKGNCSRLMRVNDWSRLNPAFDIEIAENMLRRVPLDADQVLIRTMDDQKLEFARLEYYERRALSRRKHAIRDFDAHHSPAKVGLGLSNIQETSAILPFHTLTFRYKSRFGETNPMNPLI